MGPSLFLLGSFEVEASGGAEEVDLGVIEAVRLDMVEDMIDVRGCEALLAYVQGGQAHMVPADIGWPRLRTLFMEKAGVSSPLQSP